MSMTVYPTTGSALTLTASDLREAVGITEGVPNLSIGGSVRISQDREVTKAGATRVMVKVALKAPYRDPGNVVAGTDTLAMGEITAHCVLTVPKNVTNILVYEATGATDTRGVQANIAWILAVLTAVLNDKSLASLPEISSDLPMIQACIGKLPLDVNSGTYGSAS